jgi:hypothetical protein
MVDAAVPAKEDIDQVDYPEGAKVRLFGGRSTPDASRLPGDVVRRMAVLGRFEMDPENSDVGGMEIYDTCIEPFTAFVSQDPDDFIDELRTVARKEKGLVAYGCACCVVEHLGRRTDNVAFLDILDLAIAYKRSLGLPSARLKDYELKRWVEVHGPGRW